MLGRFKTYLLHNANQKNENSISDKSRAKRFEFFKEFCSDFQKPLKIIDLGGSDYHWRNSDFKNNKDYHITIVNTETQNLQDFRNVSFIKLDIKDLKFFDDREFDIVYSNSVLEHINNSEDQKKLAEEIKRIGRHYFIQTPNYYFPMEPHFLFPFFHFFPESIKIKLIMNYSPGWFEKQVDKNKASELAASIRLLKKNELEKLFPEGKIYSEKYLLMNKSFIIYK